MSEVPIREDSANCDPVSYHIIGDQQRTPSLLIEVEELLPGPRFEIHILVLNGSNAGGKEWIREPNH